MNKGIFVGLHTLFFFLGGGGGLLIHYSTKDTLILKSNTHFVNLLSKKKKKKSFGVLPFTYKFTSFHNYINIIIIVRARNVKAQAHLE